tara:strand:+ start:193 stop:642 length:450 start_codon:yes stop_codon:yes gene_type:complete
MIIIKMVLSEEEKKERKRIAHKKWRDKNKETQKEYNTNYHQQNKEAIKKYRKEWYHQNKEKQLQRLKEYYETENGNRLMHISRWKRTGVVSTDYNLLYDNYLKSTKCEECGIEYGNRGDGTGTFKCLDHNHETGLFRNYICCVCNRKRG